MYLKDDDLWNRVHFKGRTIFHRDIYSMSYEQVWTLLNCVKVQPVGCHNYEVEDDD